MKNFPKKLLQDFKNELPQDIRKELLLDSWNELHSDFQYKNSGGLLGRTPGEFPERVLEGFLGESRAGLPKELQ